MPIRLIRVVRNLSLIGLVLGSLSASAADVGQSTADDQRPPGQPRPNPVHFADGSAVPDDGSRTAAKRPCQPPRRVSRPRLTGSCPWNPTLPPPPAPLRRPRQPWDRRLPRRPRSPTAVLPLVPVPDSKYLGPAEIEVTSFHGITPGASTRADVEKTWGKPKQSRKLDNRLDAVVLGRSVPPRRSGLFGRQQGHVAGHPLRTRFPCRTGRRAVGTVQRPAGPGFQRVGRGPRAVVSGARSALLLRACQPTRARR